MSNTKIILAFLSGSIIGSILTWRYAKGKYEKITQDEINSVKAVFSKREKTESKKNQEEETTNESESKEDEYRSILQEEGYNKKREEETLVDRPYVIPPEEFGEFDGYEKISLTYYADGMLVDENDEIVDNVEEIVGEDALTRFGEYEDDSVFVRNDSLKSDYEILLDYRKYSEVRKHNLYNWEV